MRLVVILSPAAALAAALCLAAPSPAHAGIEACGDIHVEASAECELVPPGAECELQCTPITVRATCSAELYASCSGECNATAMVECTGSCTTDCQTRCEVDPGMFECSAECQGGCEADCMGSCATGDAGAECRASCEATCSGHCDASCEGVAPSAECDAKCEARCEGSCTAEANFTCQIDCQAEGYATCTVDAQGSCTAHCETEEGALFCDGEYVDYGNNLDECVSALMDLLDIEVEGYAMAECDGDSCEAEAGGSVGCQVSGGGAALPGVLALFGLFLLGAARRSARSR
jgi:MYXO-CTERM domain-containing protein